MERTPGRVTWGKDADGIGVRELDGSEPRRPIDESWPRASGPSFSAPWVRAPCVPFEDRS
jgi:hypothetical protein